MGCNTSKRPRFKKNSKSSKDSKSSKNSKYSERAARRTRPLRPRRQQMTEPTSNESMGVPDDVKVTPMRVTFYRGGGLGEPLDAFTKISNFNAKTIAFKVVSTDPSVFMMDVTSGIIPPGESVPVKLTFINEEEQCDIGYYRVFIAFSDTMPASFLKAEDPPKHNGEFNIAVLFSLDKPPVARGLSSREEATPELKPLPQGIIVTPDVITFSCKQGQESECGVLIMNQTKKNAAFKVFHIGTGSMFEVNPVSDIVAAGKRKCITLTFKNLREMRQAHKFHVYIALVDKNELPRGFQKVFIQPPKVYDGAKALEVVFAKKDESDEPVVPFPQQKQKIKSQPGQYSSISEDGEEEEDGDGDDE